MTVSALASTARSGKSYSAKRIDEPLWVTGKGDAPLWQEARVLSDFVYPWETENPPGTAFRALHNNEWLYCLFDVIDHAVHIWQPESSDKRAVVNSSRVEIFFRRDENLNPYFCLEMDPNGRVYDYKAEFHRKFDAGWSWPEGGLIVRANRTAQGYSVEVAISKASLNALGLLHDNTLQVGLYRADCLPRGHGEPDFKWASWVKPDAPTPDFHVPSSFGTLELDSVYATSHQHLQNDQNT